MKRIFLVLLTSFFLAHLARSGSASSLQRDQRASGRPYQAETGVVASVDPGREITLEEIDQGIGKQLQGLKEKIFALRKTALESLIIRTVLESEAKSAGLSIEELKKRLTASDDPVTQSQIDEVYTENLAVFSSLSEDEAKEKVRLDLENQTRLRTYRTRVGELRNRARVRLYLNEPEPERIVLSNRGPFLGTSEAPITIYEYSDFQCPYCRRAAATVRKVLETYQGKVKVIFRHLPLPIHPQAFGAAQAAYCADDEKGFAAYHDALFEESDLSTDRFHALAAQLGLNRERFAACLASERSRAAIIEDVQEARRLGMQGTPTFVLNGKVLRGAITFEEFKRLIDQELKPVRKEQ
ncbi:MAG: thioredoxin domain-containing protein [Acidobacteriota bacterium]